jgi:hypothetical protein
LPLYAGTINRFRQMKFSAAVYAEPGARRRSIINRNVINLPSRWNESGERDVGLVFPKQQRAGG